MHTRIGVILLITFTWLLMTAVPADADQAIDAPASSTDSALSTMEAGKAHIGCGAARRARPDLPPEGPGAAPRGAVDGTDVLRYRLELELTMPPDVAFWIDGTNGMDVRVVNLPRSTFSIDLDDAYEVTSVTGAVSNWSRVGDTIQIQLDRLYLPEETFHVDVAYNGNPTTAYAAPIRWWFSGGLRNFASIAEPFYASGWWPCKNTLGDKATIDLFVTVPDPLVVASNGTLEASTPLSGDRTQFHWRESNPIAMYLVSLAIADYHIYELTYTYTDDEGDVGTMPVPCYLPPQYWNESEDRPTDTIRPSCDQLLDMLDKFEQKLGPYPFRDEKYGIAITDGLFVNMEHQTISSMVNWQYRYIMAHELAHHWFGDDITCATWHDIWLNEGLASYCEALFEEFRIGGGADAYWYQIISRQPGNKSISVYRYDDTTSDSIFDQDAAYNKGAWVCHMLRHVMGDAAFFQGLRNYRAAYGGGFATTSNFANVMSNTFGHDLSFFFNEWVMAETAPRYIWRYDANRVNGTNYLFMQIEQTQDSLGQSLVTMPIDFRITTGAGVAEHRLWNDAWTNNYVIPIDGELLDVEFDELGGDYSRHYVLTPARSLDPVPPALPPVILTADIQPYCPPTGDTTIELTFSEDIAAFDVTDFTLTGAATGVQPADIVTYDAGSHTATMEFSGLPNDNYMLRVAADGIVANDAILDGEVDDSDWHDDVLLPSGDGQPGGDAIFTFVIAAGDANCDGHLDGNDIIAFTAVLTGNDTDTCHALRCDVNGDDAVSVEDIPPFVDAILTAN
ncbi:MAG TPA: M1 family aminopeptidase [Phycisphaerae bacterium]|nr:M1 family aminopeptidase [Phycisphaerae bacterium]HRW51691.1 M1 family aminopeptidase [Phycisphaerae bacterium]